jgi:hypothetical protein
MGRCLFASTRRERRPPFVRQRTHTHTDVSSDASHQFLSYMLGVRRVAVTPAAGELQRDGLIQNSRGDITVLNRVGLEAASCSCYAAGREAYSQLLSQRNFLGPYIRAPLRLQAAAASFTGALVSAMYGR